MNTVLPKLKVLIYGGSFNPPHFSHLSIISCLLQSNVVNEIWVYPCGDRPDKHMIFSPLQRYQLLLDIYQNQYPRVQIKDREIKAGKMLPTYYLMKELEKNKEHEGKQFYFLIGSDLIPTLKGWDQGQKLREEVKFMVVRRKGYDGVEAMLEEEGVKQWQVVDCEVEELSSTEIRRVIEGKMEREEKVEWLRKKVPEEVIELLVKKEMI